MILMAGAMSDRLAVLRYADETIAAYRRLSGMDVVSALAPYLGSHVALAVGFTCAIVGWLFTWPRRPGPIESLQKFYTVVVYTASTRSLALDLEPLRALLKLVEPLRVFDRSILGGAYYFTYNFLGMALGLFGIVHDNCRLIFDILERDRITPIADMDRKHAEGGARYMVAMIAALDQDPAYARDVARLETLEMHFFDVSAEICRLVFHRLRGEEDEAMAIEARTELRLVQLGSLWGPESTLHWVSTLAYGHTRDVLGLRRRMEELVRLVAEGFHLESHLELARGEYYRERGELDVSRASLERALSLLPADEVFIRPAILTALAETHLAAHAFAEAKQRAAEGIATASHKNLETPTWAYRGERVLALAEAACGDLANASERLDRAIAAAAPLASPSISGALEEARVRVAAMAGDHLSYEVGRREVERWFRASRNPALISRLDRLPGPPRYEPKSHPPAAIGDARPASIVTGDAVTLVSSPASGPSSSAVLTGCRGAAERAARALEVLVAASSAAHGFLYLFRDGGAFELAAPLYGDEPPDELALGVHQRMEDVGHTVSDEMTEVDGGSPDQSLERLRWRPVALRVSTGGRWVSVGIAALVRGALPLEVPPNALTEQIARELYEAGDVTGVRR
jgi:hypothetical protein